MSANRNLKAFSASLNDLDARLPKSRGRCFDIGTWGGCGASCAAFADGECREPQEISVEMIEKEYDEDECQKIYALYDCFEQYRKEVPQ